MYRIMVEYDVCYHTAQIPDMEQVLGTPQAKLHTNHPYLSGSCIKVRSDQHYD